MTFGRALALASLTLSAACGSPPEPRARQAVTVSRFAGYWAGTGTRTTESVPNDSGRFRITWEVRQEQPPSQGTFRLTVRSAISGRPIKVVADHRGEGGATVDFEDEPRHYDFLIESANVEWSVSVDEIYTGYSAMPAPSSPRKH